MDAETLKEMVRRYAAEHFPGWGEVCVTVRDADGEPVAFTRVTPGDAVALTAGEIARSRPFASPVP